MIFTADNHAFIFLCFYLCTQLCTPKYFDIRFFFLFSPQFLSQCQCFLWFKVAVVRVPLSVLLQARPFGLLVANPGTIIQCTRSPRLVSGQPDPSCYIMERVFWSFGPCIQGFNYCKQVVQVDGTFLTGRYQGTLLTALAQDGSRNIFPLAFAIVEGETKEALIWFFPLLREHVTPQSNLCLITDRGKCNIPIFNKLYYFFYLF